jgi:hypothetical protein
MDNKNVQSGFADTRQIAIIDLNKSTVDIKEEKIDVEIRDWFKVRPSEFHIFKKSYEDWAKEWQ